MFTRTTLLVLVGVALVMVTVVPVSADKQGLTGNEGRIQNRDRAAITSLLNYYETAFNERDIDWRMSLCLDTYYEYGFQNGELNTSRDYDETYREVGAYWSSIDELEYSIDEIEITLDGPQAFVRAYTTHVAVNDHHASVVYFCLVKVNGVWRIAWDSYNIVRRYQTGFGAAHR